jgi:predicted nucleotidyltransferase
MSPSSALSQALAALGEALTATNARYVLIGGMAVIARGVRRHTDDIDATVWAEDISIDQLIAVLATRNIVPRISDAREFAATRQVLLLVHEPSSITMEISLGWLPFELSAIEQAESIEIADTRLRVARAEDLVIFKAVAWRDRDRSDIEKLLELHGENIDLGRVRSILREFAEALEEPERVTELDKLIARTKR